MNLANHEPFAKILFTDTQKTYMAYALTAAYLPKFSSPQAFTCMVRQNFPPPKYFLCTVGRSYYKLKLTASGNPEKLKKAVGATAVESVFNTFRRTLLCGA